MQRIDINLQPSRLFLWLFVVTIIATICIIIALPLGLLAKLGLLLAALTYGALIFYRDNLLKNQVFLATSLGWFYNINGQYIPIKISGESTLTGLVIVLRFTIEGEKRKRSVVIFKDSIDKNCYRQILVHLRTLR